MIPALVSYLVWGVAAVLLLGFELVAVFTEKRTGLLPVTRIVRDRLMKRSKLVAALVAMILGWLDYHFLVLG